jgi:flavin-dependent dehydrogenase
MLVGEGAGTRQRAAPEGRPLRDRVGRLAAEAAFRALQRGEVVSRIGALDSYDESLRASPLWNELYEVRNMRQAFDKGFFMGGALASAMTVTKGRAPNGRFPTHPNAAAPLRKTGRASPLSRALTARTSSTSSRRSSPRGTAHETTSRAT